MSFGRMNNMRRRSHRADESFHRNRRRRQVDRLGMLEPRGAGRGSPLRRVLRAVLGLITRR